MVHVVRLEQGRVRHDYDDVQLKCSKYCRGNTASPGCGHAACVVVVAKVLAVTIVAYSAVNARITCKCSQAGKPKNHANRVERKRSHRM